MSKTKTTTILEGDRKMRAISIKNVVQLDDGKVKADVTIGTGEYTIIMYSDGSLDAPKWVRGDLAHKVRTAIRAAL